MTAAQTAELYERTGGRVLYIGRPEWLTDDILQQLADEAATRRSMAVQVDKQAHSSAEPRALELARSPEVTAFVERLAGKVELSGNANYLYYDETGACIEPHIDSPDFPLQVLIMVEEHGHGPKRSALVLFPNDSPDGAIRIGLCSGQLVFFRAASIFHGRTPVQEGETACLLGIGFVPAEP